MSLGTGAFAEKIFEDDEIVSYNYGVYDLNEPELRNLAYIADGTIIIKKECFVEPEIHYMNKRINGRKKKISVRIPSEVDIVDLIRNEKIIIENSRFSRKILYEENHTDVMAYRLISMIINMYQTDDVIPDHVGYDM